MALVLFVAFGLVQPLREGVSLTRGRGALLGVLFGMSFWLNGVLFVSAGVFFGVLLVVFALLAAARSEDFAEALGAKTEEALWFIVPALALAIPQAVWLNGGIGTEGNVQMQIGYLVCSSPDASCWSNGEMDVLNIGHWGDFAEYWWLNVGLAIPLMALAMIWGSNSDRKIFLAAMAVFVFGSMFQLSRDLGGHNHKIFNLWENLTNPFVAFALVGLWNVSAQRVQLPGGTIDGRVVRSVAKFVVVPVIFVFLVLSGLLDFMTIKNDFKVEVFGEKQPAIEWIDENLPRDAVLLANWGDLPTAPTLAGRGLYLGYDPWAASAGYDVEIRKQRSAEMFGAPDKASACALLHQEGIDFVQIGPRERTEAARLNLNEGLYSAQFVAVGSVDLAGGLVTYYDVAASCGDSASVDAAG